MNNNSLEQTFTNTADAIRAKLHTQDGITPDSFASEIAKISGGGGDTDIYHVSTLAERDSLSAKENDICLVYSKSLGRMTQSNTPSNILFPKEVNLGSALADMIYADLASENWETSVMAEIDSSRARFNIDDASKDIFETVEYSSEDGIVYNISGSEDISFELSSPIKARYEWNDIIGYFINCLTLDFQGIYQYDGTNWNYLDIGLNISPEDLMNGNKVYTNAGKITGALGNTSSTASKTIENYVSITDCLHNMILSEENSSLISFNNYASGDFYVIGDNPKVDYSYNSKEIILPEVDCSNISNFKKIFHNHDNAFHQWDSSVLNCVYLGGLKNLGNNLGNYNSLTGNLNENLLRSTNLGRLCDTSIVKVIESLGTIPQGKVAGIELFPRLGKIFKNNIELFNKLISKNWTPFVTVKSSSEDFRIVNNLEGIDINEYKAAVENEEVASHKSYIAGYIIKNNSVNDCDVSINLDLSSISSGEDQTSYTLSGDYFNDYLPSFNLKFGDSVRHIYGLFNFNNCKKIGNLTIEAKNIGNLVGLFYSCINLEEIPNITLKNCHTNYITKWFQNNFSMTHLPTNLDMSVLSNGNSMQCQSAFEGCINLESLSDIADMNFPAVSGLTSMFKNCYKLTNIPNNYSFTKGTYASKDSLTAMFTNCYSLTREDIYNIYTSLLVNFKSVYGLTTSEIGITEDQWNMLSTSEKQEIADLGWTISDDWSME